MDKVIHDGNVAVLISGGFGAGWYSWNTNCPECLFDPDIVSVLEDHTLTRAEQVEKIKSLAENKWSDRGFYHGGARDLEIDWIPEGTLFYIDEYDGSESLITKDDVKFITA